MQIHIQALRRRDDVEALLRSAGWRLDPAGGAALSATHPRVKDEADARSELNKLGLLTSRGVRIEFGPPPAA
jgi:hypothetical protein